MSNRFPKIAILALAVGLVGCEGQLLDPASPDVTDTVVFQASMAQTQGSVLASIRSATARYHSVADAEADGYTRLTACIPDAGILYIKFALVDGVVDPTQPEHLLYDELPTGRLRLVAVQYVVPSGAWDPFNSSAPALGDQPFMDRRSIPFGAPFPNYALFAWIWHNNPNGMYQQFNPNVNCL